MRSFCAPYLGGGEEVGASVSRSPTPPSGMLGSDQHFRAACPSCGRGDLYPGRRGTGPLPCVALIFKLCILYGYTSLMFPLPDGPDGR